MLARVRIFDESHQLIPEMKGKVPILYCVARVLDPDELIVFARGKERDD